MIIVESILDDETLVQRDSNTAQELADDGVNIIIENAPFRMFTRIGFANSRIIRGELEAINIRLFIEELDEILDHACFIDEHRISGQILVIEGANFTREILDFPVYDRTVETLADTVDVTALKKKYPTLALDFNFYVSFTVPSRPPKYKDYLRSMHNIIDLIGNWFENYPLKFYHKDDEGQDAKWLGLKVNRYNPESQLAKIYDMLFDLNYAQILMLDNHNAVLRQSRIDKICRQFADSRDDVIFGGMEKFKYNPYNRNVTGTDKDRQVAFLYLNFKEDKAPKMEDVLFDIYKNIICYMPIRALRELTICLVCKCNKGFDYSLYSGVDRLSNCNKRIAKENKNPKILGPSWLYVENNASGSDSFRNFFYWCQNSFKMGFYVMLMKTQNRLTSQKIKYYGGESWANYIQPENRY